MVVNTQVNTAPTNAELNYDISRLNEIISNATALKTYIIQGPSIDHVAENIHYVNDFDMNANE